MIHGTVSAATPAPGPQLAPVLRLSRISKSFAGVRALTDVSVDIAPGEVHAVLGANGAGKSTLMSIATGALAADAGWIEVDGRRLPDADPATIRAAGVSVVTQHQSLLRDLSVAENLAFLLRREDRPRYRDRRAWTTSRLGELAHDALRDVDPDAPVGSLSLQQRQLVEIARALIDRPRVLVLDEPTEPLDHEQAEQLFLTLERLKADGTAIVYVSHRLPEVRRLADRVTVLREGRSQGSYRAHEMTDDQVVELIVGRRLQREDLAARDADTGRLAASSDGLTLAGFQPAGFSEPLNLVVRPGEIVGVAGIAGNGQKTLLRAVCGLHRSTGSAQVDGRAYRANSAPRAHAAGIAYVSGDRRSEGRLPGLSVRDNMTISALARFSRAGVIDRRRETAAVSAQIDELSIRAAAPDAGLDSLSGGNQQKVSLARALETRPRVLVVDDPTNGVDVGAREEIYRIIKDAGRAGCAVLVTTTDNDELVRLCDRAVVLSRGHIETELAGEDLTPAAVDSAAVLTTKVRTASATPTRRSRATMSGDRPVLLTLALAVLALGALTTARNASFLSPFNISSVLQMIAVLGFVSIGQVLIVTLGSVDLSVGPLLSVLVVVASFTASQTATGIRLVLGLLVLPVIAVGVAVVNAVMTRRFRITPLAATLATFIGLQGLALWLRPTTNGTISAALTSALNTGIGLVPAAFIALAALTVVGHLVLRRSRWGVVYRAVGSDEHVAKALGQPVTRVHVVGYALASLLCVPAAITLAAQIGTGDPAVGNNYTLNSIAVVVLAGTALAGGRSNLVAALLASSLIEEGVNVTTFLNLDSAWQFWLVGSITLLAATAYTVLRARAARHSTRIS